MKQGEIWLIDLNPTVGAEIQKIRPAVIVSHDSLGKLPLKIIVTITDWKENYFTAPWMIHIVPSIRNGLTKESAVDCFQVRSLSEKRFVRKLGSVQFDDFASIKRGLAKVLSINQ